MAIATLTSTENGANSLADINANFADLDTTKADLDSPNFTGVPLSTTPSASDNSTKVATTAFVMSQIPITGTVLTIETTTGVTHSLTTTAGQKVIVWAKGDMTGDSSAHTATLAYNGVTKDVVTMDMGSGDKAPFSVMYTETPGAGTYNVTVTSAASLANVVIIVMKIG